jgi:hypothetical protein
MPTKGLTDGPAATREGKRPKLSPLLLPFSLVFFTLCGHPGRGTLNMATASLRRGGFFDAETVRKANAELKNIESKYKKDVAVETFGIRDRIALARGGKPPVGLALE